MIYPGKFGGIPSTGSRNVVGTRFCHADANAATDADPNGIRTETNMSPPSPLMGGGDINKGLWPYLHVALLVLEHFGPDDQNISGRYIMKWVMHSTKPEPSK